MLTKPNEYYTEQGRADGVALHILSGFLAQGKVPAAPPDERIAGRVEGIRKFIRDTGFKIAGGETPQYDPVLGYACLPDIWGSMGVWTWVIDFKRGGKLPTHRLQTVAQQIALSAGGFRAQKRGCLYLRDGDYRLDEHTDTRDRGHWRNFVQAWHSKQEYK